MSVRETAYLDALVDRETSTIYLLGISGHKEPSQIPTSRKTRWIRLSQATADSYHEAKLSLIDALAKKLKEEGEIVIDDGWK